jgi:hypothetical protein
MVSQCTDVIQNPDAEFSGDVLGWILHFAFAPGVANGTYNIFLQQNESLRLLNIQVDLSLTGIVCPEIGDITLANMTAFVNSLTGCSILHILSNGSDGNFHFYGGLYAKKNGTITTELNDFPANTEVTISVCTSGIQFFRSGYRINNTANEGVNVSGTQPNVRVNDVSYRRICSFSDPDPDGIYRVKFNAATTICIIKRIPPITYYVDAEIPVAADTYVDLLNLYNTYSDAQIAIVEGQGMTATFIASAFGDSVSENQIIP